MGLGSISMQLLTWLLHVYILLLLLLLGMWV
jgi:hypothetical protein